jgi:type II secretory pathway pseudopilin PulG
MKRLLSGFTLVEMLVAIGITMLIATLLLIGANSFLSKEKVKQVSAELASYLSAARNLAATNQGPSGFKIDYVAVTLTTDGILKAYPVNASGVGSSYFTKTVVASKLSITSLNLGDLQFAAGSGKLLGKNASNFGSYPLPSNQEVGISVVTTDYGDKKLILINSFGTITVN